MPEATLNAIPIFHDLDEPALKALGALCEERTLEAGDYLYRHGVARTEMFFVRSGEVEILSDFEDDTTVIANLGEWSEREDKGESVLSLAVDFLGLRRSGSCPPPS